MIWFELTGPSALLTPQLSSTRSLARVVRWLGREKARHDALVKLWASGLRKLGCETAMEQYWAEANGTVIKSDIEVNKDATRSVRR